LIASAHELGVGAGGVEAAQTLLQRGVRMNGERAELSFVEGISRRWAVLGVTAGGDAMNVNGEAREEVMRGAIVVIHETWPMSHDLCLLSSCAHHLPATLTILAVIPRTSRLLSPERPRTSYLGERVSRPVKPEGCPCCSTFDFRTP
jgi:hypothetical protein